MTTMIGEAEDKVEVEVNIKDVFVCITPLILDLVLVHNLVLE